MHRRRPPGLHNVMDHLSAFMSDIRRGESPIKEREYTSKGLSLRTQAAARSNPAPSRSPPALTTETALLVGRSSSSLRRELVLRGSATIKRGASESPCFHSELAAVISKSYPNLSRMPRGILDSLAQPDQENALQLSSSSSALLGQRCATAGLLSHFFLLRLATQRDIRRSLRSYSS